MLYLFRQAQKDLRGFLIVGIGYVNGKKSSYLAIMRKGLYLYWMNFQNVLKRRLSTSERKIILTVKTQTRFFSNMARNKS